MPSDSNAARVPEMPEGGASGLLTLDSMDAFARGLHQATRAEFATLREALDEIRQSLTAVLAAPANAPPPGYDVPPHQPPAGTAPPVPPAAPLVPPPAAPPASSTTALPRGIRPAEPSSF